MFTGIVQHVGTVRNVARRADACALSVDAGPVAEGAAAGDSICVDGACLTVTGASGPLLSFDVGAETLRRTTLGELHEGARVNLEPSLRVGDRLGGHFVSGHVDGVGVIRRKDELSGEVRLRVEVEPALSADMVMKGSVAVDGISLTVAGLERDAFEVSLVPYTLAVTTMGHKGPGDHVNVECDMIGRWVKRVLEGGTAQVQGRPLSIPELEDQGF